MVGKRVLPLIKRTPMHDIEPFYLWRDDYVAAEDDRSPFYGRQYSEFHFTNKIYNYFIHPQWDDFGSHTLYLKVLFADYEEGYAIIEFIGEWNDCLYDDIMYLKRDLMDHLIESGIYKFILICENVLNFHAGDDDYYEEWYEDIRDEEGWIVFVNTLKHVEEEMTDGRLQYYTNFGPPFNQVNWRPYKPKAIFEVIEAMVYGDFKRLKKG
jgi:hypothetical protein